jgi:hypothetical protein
MVQWPIEFRLEVPRIWADDLFTIIATNGANFTVTCAEEQNVGGPKARNIIGLSYYILLRDRPPS